MKENMKKLDALNSELHVEYCIPNWLRDTQVKWSINHYKERIQVAKEKMTEPIALVCFGPSLNQTWEKVKDFKYIMSCSGSHKFLRERGIAPTFHVEVDPRPHKVKLIGEDIHPDTTFLLASCCHPEVFHHIEDRKGKIVLWHTYSGEKDTLPNVFPRDEWALTGGANVGLRALTIARFLGFTDIHIFGMDGCFPAVEGGLKHAAEHPNVCKDFTIATYNGKDYATTTAFLECARMTKHELEVLPDVNATFYGEGLVQDIMKNEPLNRIPSAKIAFYSASTISEPYRQLNKTMHDDNPYYGISVIKYMKTITNLYSQLSCKSLLDYGCGKGILAKLLDFPIWEYDPAIVEKSTPPRPADLVVCIDVLEHIEPDYLDSTLADIARCTKKIAYFIISGSESLKTLPDGRNTHLIIKDKLWWTNKLREYFILSYGSMMERMNKEKTIFEYHVVVAPKTDKYFSKKCVITEEAKV